MVAQLRERNFILSRYGGEVYGFVHRAFLEYLAAADIAHRYKEDREWTPEELVAYVIDRHAEDSAWHEVILLVIGQIPERDAAHAIDRLLQLHRSPDHFGNRMLVLAVRALAEVTKIRTLASQSGAVADALCGAVSDSFLAGEAGLGAALPALETFNEYWTGRQRYLHWFLLRGQHLEEVSDAAEVAGALRLSVELAHALALFSPAPGVRGMVLSEISRLTKDVTTTRTLWMDRATSDPHEEPRRTALQLLSRSFVQHSQAVAALRDRSSLDSVPALRIEAFQAWAAATDACEVYEVGALALDDEHPDVRCCGIWILGFGCPGDPRGRETLQQRAQSDPEPDVRSAAAEALKAAEMLVPTRT
ncbi:HEAT repeat domain-containing protein [Streptomyces sp. NPDC058613]|uniref:HEAT repeat domain-containing protein n=1 Tax=Streptomyces sp. NPDC058613 TaxID=3346556 RepID=UPI00364E1921